MEEKTTVSEETTVRPRKGWQQRIRESRLGTLLVLAVTAALVTGGAYLLERPTATASGLQAIALSGPTDGGPGAGLELAKIGLDPITANHAGFRHQRFQHQWNAGRDPAKYKAGLRGLARKRFPHREAKVIGIPGKLALRGEMHAGPLSGRFGAKILNNSGRAGQQALKPARRTHPGRDDHPTG